MHVDRLSLAVVGSRRSSHEAKTAAYSFSGFAAVNGVAVVSGLALGCDTAAHLGCLDSGGYTVAVLPCGLNFVAPASNRPLAKRIKESGGSLISEYSPARRFEEPAWPPRPFRFIARNRVIVSLSQAVVVMEAEAASGTMHTTRFALEQGKPLACYVPEFGPVSSGCRLLIENHGALPLRNESDLALFLETLSNTMKPNPFSWQGRGEGGWRV